MRLSGERHPISTVSVPKFKQCGFWQDYRVSSGKNRCRAGYKSNPSEESDCQTDTQHWDIITDNLVAIKKRKQNIVANLSWLLHLISIEIVMYQFHYETILPKYGSRAKLAHADTDSLIYHIQTPDIYIYKTCMLTTRPTIRVTTPLFERNAKLLGKKRTNDRVRRLHEFVSLHSKMYSIRLPNNKAKFTAKRISRKYIVKHLQHADYLPTLKTARTTTATFTALRPIMHKLKTLSVTKHCLSTADDKR